jgi:hypothetical protein
MWQAKLSFPIATFFYGTIAPCARPSPLRRFTITLRHTALGRTPLDEWPARHWDLYLNTHNTHKRQTSMPPARVEPVWPQSDTLDRAAIGSIVMLALLKSVKFSISRFSTSQKFKSEVITLDMGLIFQWNVTILQQRPNPQGCWCISPSWHGLELPSQ